MVSRKSVALGLPTTSQAAAADTNVSIQPHAGVSSPARTVFPGKHAPGSEHSPIDRRQGGETSGISLQENEYTQPREEVSGERRPQAADVQIPEVSTELPPVYSPV